MEQKPADMYWGPSREPPMPNLKAHTLIDTTQAVASFIDALVRHGINRKVRIPTWANSWVVGEVEQTSEAPTDQKYQVIQPCKSTTFAGLRRPSGADIPGLYFDAEGNNLSRHGTLSILQVYVLPLDHVYLIDVTVLKAAAFDTSGEEGLTLRKILEDPAIPKVFFDVRNDSDALYTHHGVNLQGIHDLQLMYLGTFDHVSSITGLASLEVCIRADAGISEDEQAAMTELKRSGKRLFCNGYGVFDERPLKSPLAEYCVQDVQHMPTLWATYANVLTKERWKLVLEISAARVKASQSEDYSPTGWNKGAVPVQFWTKPDTGQQYGPFY